jgi:hypothetical protein
VPLTLPCIRSIRNRLGRNVDAGGRYLSVDEASRRYIVPEYPPRAYWKGYLKLSLVSCPIALYPATSEREKISFNQLNKETGNRIRYRKVDAETGDEVEQGIRPLPHSTLAQQLRISLSRATASQCEGNSIAQ